MPGPVFTLISGGNTSKERTFAHPLGGLAGRGAGQGLALAGIKSEDATPGGARTLAGCLLLTRQLGKAAPPPLPWPRRWGSECQARLGGERNKTSSRPIKLVYKSDEKGSRSVTESGVRRNSAPSAGDARSLQRPAGVRSVRPPGSTRQAVYPSRAGGHRRLANCSYAEEKQTSRTFTAGTRLGPRRELGAGGRTSRQRSDSSPRALPCVVKLLRGLFSFKQIYTKRGGERTGFLKEIF